MPIGDGNLDEAVQKAASLWRNWLKDENSDARF